MARARVVVHQAAVRALAGSAEVGRGMVDRMQPALDKAEGDAPVLTGRYRDSLTVEAYEQDGAAGARLIADVDYAVYVEAQSGTLSRSLDAIQDT